MCAGIRKAGNSNIRGDVFGGITAGIVALPLALAFGVQSGLGATAGLYGAIALGFFAAVFGGTHSQISGPTGPMTVLSASFAGIFIARYGGIDNALGTIILIFALAGIFQILFGLLRIGKYIKYIPYPVLSGFMSGIGIIIILLQLFPAGGLPSPAGTVDVLSGITGLAANADIIAVLVTIVTIALIYLFPLLTRTVPSTLIALVLVSLASYRLMIDVPMIGSMPSGLPSLRFPSFAGLGFDDIGLILSPAITLAGLGAIDSLLTSVVADNMTRTRHNSDKELIGQGIGNIAASLVGGIPGAGATMRTVINIRSGGKTKLSGVFHSVFLLLILLGLGRFVAYIPLPALAGVLITVGISIIDIKGMKNIFRIPKADGLILVITLVITVFVDLLQAVGIGMVLASLVFMRKASIMVEQNTSLSKVDIYDREIPWEDEAGLSLNKWSHVYIKRFDGPMFFGVASRMLERINKIPSDAKIIIFRMKRVPYIDQSGLYAFEEVVKEMQKAGITVVLTMTQPQPLYLFRKTRLVPNIIPEKYLFRNIEECAAWLREHQGKIDQSDDVTTWINNEKH